MKLTKKEQLEKQLARAIKCNNKAKAAWTLVLLERLEVVTEKKVNAPKPQLVSQKNSEPSISQLEGSDKQIAWAEKIRNNFLGNYLPKALQGTIFESESKRMWTKSIVFNFLSQGFSKASRWIEYRDNFAYLTSLILKELDHQNIFCQPEFSSKEEELDDIVNNW